MTDLMKANDVLSKLRELLDPGSSHLQLAEDIVQSIVNDRTLRHVQGLLSDVRIACVQKNFDGAWRLVEKIENVAGKGCIAHNDAIRVVEYATRCEKEREEEQKRLKAMEEGQQKQLTSLQTLVNDLKKERDEEVRRQKEEQLRIKKIRIRARESPPTCHTWVMDWNYSTDYDGGTTFVKNIPVFGWFFTAAGALPNNWAKGSWLVEV